MAARSSVGIEALDCSELAGRPSPLPPVRRFVYGANSPERQALFQTGWFTVGLLTQTLIVHMIRTERIPFVQEVGNHAGRLLKGGGGAQDRLEGLLGQSALSTGGQGYDLGSVKWEAAAH